MRCSIWSWIDIAILDCVSNGYTRSMSKDAGMRIRVERELREAFLAICRTQDRPAAQVLRQFMREYVIENADLLSGDHKAATAESDEGGPGTKTTRGRK